MVKGNYRYRYIYYNMCGVLNGIGELLKNKKLIGRDEMMTNKLGKRVNSSSLMV